MTDIFSVLYYRFTLTLLMIMLLLEDKFKNTINEIDTFPCSFGPGFIIYCGTA